MCHYLPVKETVRAVKQKRANRRAFLKERKDNMRLDKYLKVSRLIKRRSVANDACDSARVTVNGREAKASYQVKPGDVIEITFGSQRLCVEVTAVTENAGKAEAAAMYREV